MVKTSVLKFLKTLIGPGLWLFIGAMAIYTLTGAFYSNFISDGDVMYAVTVQLAEHHSVALQPDPGKPQIVQGRNGNYYSKYGIGQSLAAYPFYRFGHRYAYDYGLKANAAFVMPFFFTRFLPIMATAATVWLVYLFSKLLYDSTKIGIGIAVIYGLGTSAWPYSRYFFSEPLFTLCTFGAAFTLYLVKRANNKWWRGGWLIVSGFLLGYGLLVRVSGAALLPAYAVYLWLLVAQRIKADVNFADQLKNTAQKSLLQKLFANAQTYFTLPRLKAFVSDGLLMVVGALPTLAVLLLYNYVRFGSPFNNGYDDETFSTPIWEGLYGLLFSPGKSVFLYSPVLIAVPFALRGFWRRFQSEAIMFGLVIGITIIYYSMWWAWWGGASWGPRFLVPLLPFAVMSLGLLWQRSWRWVAICWVVLFPLAVLVQMLGVVPDFNVYINSITHGDPALDHIYIFDFSKSPLFAHWQMLWNPADNTVRSLILEQVGLNQNTAQNFSPSVLILSVISTLFICYNYLTKQTKGVNQQPTAAQTELATSK